MKQTGIVTMSDVDFIVEKIMKQMDASSPDKSYEEKKEKILFMLLNTKPMPLMYNDIEIRASKIHGNGIFATKDIPKDVIVTFYPAHSIQKGSSYVAFTSDDDFIDNMQKYVDEYGFGISDSLFMLNKEGNVACDNDHEINQKIIGNPNETTNTLLLGHMINDASINVYKEKDTLIPISTFNNLTLFKNSIASYFINGMKNKNCQIKTNKYRNVVGVVTTKEIKKGDELLGQYGPLYWFEYTYGSKYTGQYLKNFAFLLKDPVFNEFTCTHCNEKIND